ncbi:UNVERIFIED_CONTAM: hypothetical protein FKN15_031281 [Acipenser sinensis]
MSQAQQELLSVEDSIYMPDQDASNPLINRNLIQKAGYLNIRSKTGLVTTSWDRLYFFTQGGNLMCQPRGAVAGGMVLDLDNSSVMAVDCEDRRYCFQITSPDGAQIPLENLKMTALRNLKMFVVRFLGSMAVRSHRSKEVIYEAMRQVLAARAIHNIFRTAESQLIVTSKSLQLIDPQTQVTRISFQLRDVVQFAAHQENRRLMGFVVEGPEISEEMEPSLSAYVFESNTEGEKICYTISLGKELIEAEKDPEALALLMKSMPLTSDGKFLVLESETGGAVQNGAEEGLESEA